MTLILTHLSNAGIAMAADSAITMLQGHKIISKEKIEWEKLIKVPKINAAISYWGIIGAVTKKRFDEWLRLKIETNNYSNLSTLADYLSEELNKACNNKPLTDGNDVGIHVAGFQKWSDEINRPTFYHIHNGHGHIASEVITDSNNNLIKIEHKWVSEHRKLFEKHFDFPKPEKSLDENINILRDGYITRNGDFLIYHILNHKLIEGITYLNLDPKIQIPKKSNDLGTMKGFLHILLNFISDIYKCSNQPNIVGGKIITLGIREKGYLL